jgi:hypothetical protein
MTDAAPAPPTLPSLDLDLVAISATVRDFGTTMRAAAEAISSAFRFLTAAYFDANATMRDVHRRDFPNAVPLQPSIWRRRKERRRYGRELTHAERMDLWRRVWGGLCEK